MGLFFLLFVFAGYSQNELSSNEIAQKKLTDKLRILHEETKEVL